MQQERAWLPHSTAQSPQQHTHSDTLPRQLLPRSLVVEPLCIKQAGGPSGDPAVQAAARSEAVKVALAASRSGLAGQLHSCVQSLLINLGVLLATLPPLPQAMPQTLTEAVRQLEVSL
jgi:hypothetical protein